MFGALSTRLLSFWRVLAVMVLVLVAATHGKVALAQSEAIDPDVADAVTAAMQELVDAFVVKDLDTLSAMVTDSFVLIDTEGQRLGKEEWLTFPDQLEFVNIDGSEVELMQVSPDVVILTGVFSIEGTWEGEPWSSTEIDTFTWVLRDGEWLVAANHASSHVSEAERMAQAVESALSAAPAAIAEGASVMVPSEDGTFNVVHEGDNGVSCLPDDPMTVQNDPFCFDAEAMKLFEAYVAGEEPVYDGIGIMYGLQGTAIASATDPMMMAPAEGEEWIVDGPNIRLVSPEGFDAEMFPAEPGTGLPYVIWDGTPYEHLVIPVGDAAADEEMGAIEE